MGGLGAVALPEKAEPAVEKNSYSALSSYEAESMPKIIYVAWAKEIKMNTEEI